MYIYGKTGYSVIRSHLRMYLPDLPMVMERGSLQR